MDVLYTHADISCDDRLQCSSGMNGTIQKVNGGERMGWKIGPLRRMEG